MSGVVRFFSDPHFGHLNMARKRGFQDEFYMGEHIVEKWNSVVKKGDVTYIMGDITMEKSSDYYWLDRLNGIKKVVLGNHDEPQHVSELLKYVNKVAGMINYKDKEFGSIILTHCPIHPREFEYRCDFNIHGHIHEFNVEIKLEFGSVIDRRYINVSAENINYTPMTLKQLIERT